MVTLFCIFIGYGISSVYELEPSFVLYRIYNLVVDLLQEAPYFFVTRVKVDSDSGVNWAEGGKATWGNPLQKNGFLLQLVNLIIY